MPIGIIANVAAVILGGLCGTAVSSRLSDSVKQQMNWVMAVCAMGMGISAVVLGQNLPPVVFSVIVGTFLGLLTRFGQMIEKGADGVLKRVLPNADQETSDVMLTAVVLFCASGTGIYGALDSGMTGNHTILLAKTVLDFFTAMIFACRLGKTVCFVALPQFVVMMILFLLAKVIVPVTTTVMIADFKACGGFLLIATAFRIMQLRMLPVADMIPAMVLVMPVSWLWTTWILPLLS